MAKAFKTPEELPPPEVDYANFDAVKYEAAQRKWKADLSEYCRWENKGALVGRLIYTPRGDGMAVYMVYREKPLELLWLETGDAWAADPVWLRGLRLEDVRTMLKRQDGMAELFRSGGKTGEHA